MKGLRPYPGRPAALIAKHFILKVIWRKCPNPGHPELFGTCSVFPVRWLHRSRRAQVRAPQDEVLNPHGEQPAVAQRAKARRLEPRGRDREIERPSWKME
jgi:hypothetical protein